MSVIALKNWERYQHYGDRDPTWIKLYRDILTSEAWLVGTDLSRLLQVSLALLAARYKNSIPYRFDLLKKAISLDCTESNFAKALEHLLAMDFLEIQESTVSQRTPEQIASALLAERYAREEEDQRRKIRKEREEKIRKDVEFVFDHWKTIWGKPRAKLDLKRSTLIERALEGYETPELCEAISGYRNSPHHTGQNERQTVYDDIGLLLRDAQHIDAGLRFAEQKPLTSNLANHNVAVLSDWKPPELRDATSRHGEVSGDLGESSGGIRQAALPAAS